MKKLLVVLLSFYGFSGTASSITVCPADLDGQAEQIEIRVQDLLTKGQLPDAAELAQVCASWNSSQDVNILGPVFDAYYLALDKVLSGPVQTRMEKELGRCEKRAGEGTMGASFKFHCGVKVLKRYYADYIRR